MSRPLKKQPASTLHGQAGNAALSHGPMPQEELRSLIAAAVPPSMAIARAAGMRRWSAKNKGYVNGGKPWQQLDDVMVGAKSVALRVIRMRLESGRWVKLPDGRIATREWVEQHQSD